MVNDVNELICPKCKNEEGTTTFVCRNSNNPSEEYRICDDENCGCEYKVSYIVDDVKILMSRLK